MSIRSSGSIVFAIVVTGATHGDASIGPDVITGALPSTIRWATDATETAYSMAITTCNVGDEDLDFISSPSTRHPVRGQNMFRLSADGRFEQIGQAWLLHAFCALQLPLAGCGDCDGPAGCLSRIVPGCSDPNSAGTAGSQIGLSPKWQVNAHTGEFAVPWDQGEGTGGEFRRRLRVRNVDIDPSLNPGAQYFIECQQVAKDDSAAGNQNNNASYRQVSVSPTTFNLTIVGATQQQQPGIQAWQDVDPSVTLVDAQVPGEGLFIVGYKVADNGDGTWSYEYAVYNMNSHRSAGVFRVPIAPRTTITDVGFHDVDYHSGEAWDSTDWSSTIEPDGVRWWTTPYEIDEFANALRWGGTIYNFRFIATTPPIAASARLDLFRPGIPEAIEIPVLVPSTPGCPLDVDLSGDVGFTDLLTLLSHWGVCPVEGACIGDLDGSGDVGFVDLVLVLAGWGEC